MARRDPYKQIKVNGRKMYEHRWVMEQHLGRSLRSDELAHHRNEDKRDNRIENLELTDAVTHGRGHHLVYPLTKTCVVCGGDFTPHKTKRRVRQTCGPECRAALISRRQAS